MDKRRLHPVRQKILVVGIIVATVLALASALLNVRAEKQLVQSKEALAAAVSDTVCILILNDKGATSDAEARQLIKANSSYSEEWITRFVDEVPIKRVSAKGGDIGYSSEEGTIVAAFDHYAVLLGCIYSAEEGLFIFREWGATEGFFFWLEPSPADII